MENNKCIKCEDVGNMTTITINDGELISTMGEPLCKDCHNSLMTCIIEMIYENPGESRLF